MDKLVKGVLNFHKQFSVENKALFDKQARALILSH